MRVHHFRSAAVVVLALALASRGQQASDPAIVLQQTRERVLADLSRLPRYTCIQAITRNYFSGPAHLRGAACTDLMAAHDARKHALTIEAWDRLRLEVAIIEGGNEFSWVGARRFEAGALEKLAGGGPLGSGDFGFFLAGIFRQANMSFQGTELANGRQLLNYLYNMPMGKTQYHIKTDEGWVLTAYKGTLQLDPDAKDVVSLSVRTTELPPGSNACQAISEVEYGRTLIHDRMILIPVETRLRTIYRTGGESLSLTKYAGCREYASQSRVLAEAPKGSAGTGAALPQSPPGPRLATRIITPIDSDTAWAGDPIEAILRSPMRDKKQGVLAPVGARLHGRLVRVERRYGERGGFQIGMEFESIEINGQAVPLRAAPYTIQNPTVRLDYRSWTRDHPRADPGAFTFPGDHFRFKHFDSEWITIAPASQENGTDSGSGHR